MSGWSRIIACTSPHQSSGFIGTEDKWRERRRYCVNAVTVFTSFARWEAAIEYKKGVRPLSLGTFKPVAITNLKAEHADGNMHTQMGLFDEENRNQYWENGGKHSIPLLL